MTRMSQESRGRGECSTANQPRVPPPPLNPPALPGGYKIGDQVISCVEQQDFGNNSGSLSIGDEGTVLAPCDASASDADRGLACRFPKKSSIYMHGKQIRRPVEFEEWISMPLPGGYKIGDRVICCMEQVFDNGGSISIGDEGTVLGPAYADEPSASDADRRILCRFPKKSSIKMLNVLVKQIRRPEEFEEWISTPLPGGYKIGDRVICCIEQVSDNGVSISISDEGTVLGPDYDDEPSVSNTADRFVQCIFPQMRASDDLLVSEIRRPLPGGYKVGDRVICCIQQDLGNRGSLSVGDEGVVLGPATGNKSGKFPSKFIITCQGCKTMMQAPKQCRQLTCYKCKAVIAAATYPQLDATRNKSEPDAHKRISCNFPTKMTQVDVLVTQILPPSEFRDYLEQTMVLRTVRPVQRLLLAAMTLRTMQDSSNDQSAVQVRL